ncbi:succinylglutamate desuccinylase [Photobacterium leiognathi]|uniref:succinylglutamate desuccinylase n=1 Tax=Photobacterium leiognathi TaxID=553611 RepID=UPI000769FDCD|nr:succinylglutamate desuccinylase [Photobacterium leiognathi]
MTFVDEVKRGRFLSATCDLSLPFVPADWVLESGIHCQLLQRGVLQITPNEQISTAKDIVLSSGVHGNETAPIELVQQLAEGILLGHIEPVHRLLLIIAHPEAINHKTRFIEENMNRLFKVRNSERNIDCKVANQLQEAVNSFYGVSTAVQPERWHLDLHCAIRPSEHYTFAISPYSHKHSRSNSLFSFIQHAKIEAVLLANDPSSTFSWFSAEYHGAQALTIELGKVADFGNNNLALLAHFSRAMMKLVTESSLPITWNNDVEVYRVSRTLLKQSDDFNFSFPDDLPNFTFFDEGVYLGSDSGEAFIADEKGEAVVFPNANVALGQRAALMVKKAHIIFEEQIRLCG